MWIKFEFKGPNEHAVVKSKGNCIMSKSAFGFVTALVLTLVVITFGFATEAEAQYRIQNGDRLTIEVLEDTSLNRSILVLPDGNFSFPLAGSVPARGRTVDAVQAELRDKLASNFAVTPTVFVAVASLNPTEPATGRAIDVFLLGEVNAPGKFEVAQGTTLLQFLAESGGLTRFAAKKRLQLRRRGPDGNEQVFGFNFRDMERGVLVQGASAPLRDGDVIVVPERRLFE